MVRIKLCGITTTEDLVQAQLLCPDFLGFVLADSPRRVTIDRLAILCQELDTIPGVAVVVNPSWHELEALRQIPRITHVQFCGDEPEALLLATYEELGLVPIVARSPEHTHIIQYTSLFTRIPEALLLLDSRKAGQVGGTGTPCDWDKAATIARDFPRVLLAGGLNPHNVSEAIRQVNPWGVDVSSGIEATPGRKSLAKMTAFVENTRNAHS